MNGPPEKERRGCPSALKSLPLYAENLTSLLVARKLIPKLEARDDC